MIDEERGTQLPRMSSPTKEILLHTSRSPSSASTARSFQHRLMNHLLVRPHLTVNSDRTRRLRQWMLPDLRSLRYLQARYSVVDLSPSMRRLPPHPTAGLICRPAEWRHGWGPHRYRMARVSDEQANPRHGTTHSRGFSRQCARKSRPHRAVPHASHLFPAV